MQVSVRLQRASAVLWPEDGRPGPFARYPFDTPFVRRWVDRCLMFWFGLWAFLLVEQFVATPQAFGFDVRLYRLAAQAWLDGGDPWAVRSLWSHEFGSFGYAGPPQTLLPFLLFAWVPENVLVLIFMLAAFATAMWVLRRLHLPLWWLAFPPIVEGIWVGNLNIFVIALLVAGGTIAGTLATTLKSYAALPLLLLGRWKPLLIAAALAVITVPFLPWADFIRESPQITATLAVQSWGGRTNLLTTPPAVLLGAIALLLLGRERGAWLSVPVIWPATQLHYAVIGLPATTRFLAFFAAVPIPGFFGLGVIVLAASEIAARVTGFAPSAVGVSRHTSVDTRQLDSATSMETT